MIMFINISPEEVTEALIEESMGKKNWIIYGKVCVFPYRVVVLYSHEWMSREKP